MSPRTGYTAASLRGQLCPSANHCPALSLRFPISEDVRISEVPPSFHVCISMCLRAGVCTKVH